MDSQRRKGTNTTIKTSNSAVVYQSKYNDQEKRHLQSTSSWRKDQVSKDAKRMNMNQQMRKES